MKCAYRKTNLGPGYTVVSCCLAALLTLTVLETRTAIADGRGYACQLYSEITPDPEVFCSIVDLQCVGTCGKFDSLPEGQDCGYCTETGGWFDYCKNKPVWYVPFAQLNVPCEYKDIKPGIEVVLACLCGSSWVQVGTTTNGCYCP